MIYTFLQLILRLWMKLCSLSTSSLLLLRKDLPCWLLSGSHCSWPVLSSLHRPWPGDFCWWCVRLAYPLSPVTLSPSWWQTHQSLDELSCPRSRERLRKVKSTLQAQPFAQPWDCLLRGFLPESKGIPRLLCAVAFCLTKRSFYFLTFCCLGAVHLTSFYLSRREGG